MTIPHEILRLIERFEQNREAYHSDPYNETQLRREFVDPFFEALGWDVDNKQGYAELFKNFLSILNFIDLTVRNDLLFHIVLLNRYHYSCFVINMP
ncbi:MAG: hypothetical protein ABSE95_07560 [Thermodesulfobacteriota bacterium]